MYAVRREETVDTWLSHFSRTHGRPCPPHQRHPAPEDPAGPGRGFSGAARAAPAAGLSPRPGTAGWSRSMFVRRQREPSPEPRCPGGSPALWVSGKEGGVGRGLAASPPPGGEGLRSCEGVPGPQEGVAGASALFQAHCQPRQHGGPRPRRRGLVTRVRPWRTCACSSENRNSNPTRTLPVRTGRQGHRTPRPCRSRENSAHRPWWGLGTVAPPVLCKYPSAYFVPGAK